MNQKQFLEKEWAALQKREKKYIKQHQGKAGLSPSSAMKKIIPGNLETVLQDGFFQGFQMVFTKGMGTIEKICQKEKHQRTYEINQFAAKLNMDGKSLKAFKKQAQSTKLKNMALSGMEGVGLGVLGVGLADIWLFTGVLLKSIYEIALSYGFSYDTEEEQCLILRIICLALYKGEDFDGENAALNRILYQMNQGEHCFLSRDEEMRQAALALSEELLIMKFIQGLPIAGVIGGISDFTCLSKVSQYAVLKYHRRFLLKTEK